MSEKKKKRRAPKRHPMEVHQNGEPHGAPSVFDPTKGGTKCGAKKKQGPGYCGNPAGYNTDHLGEGKCYLHGGDTPIKHGRYSKVKRKVIRDLVEDYSKDPRPHDLTEDLNIMRALFHLMLEKKVLDPLEAAKLLEMATKLAERWERMRNSDTISRHQLNKVMSDMGRVVNVLVQDPALRQKIHEGWMNIPMP